MSIELKVEKYCSDCPNFEARVEKLEFAFSDGCLTVITCERDSRCKSMYNHLIKCIEKEKSDD